MNEKDNRKGTEKRMSRSEREAGWAAAMSRAADRASKVWGLVQWSNFPPWWVLLLGFFIAWVLIVTLAK